MKIKTCAVGLASFTLKRMGIFSVNTAGINHCGTFNPLAIKYTLEVRCTADSLDDRGFLFDQTKVDKWFQSLRLTELSCEQFCIFCGREIYKLIRRENANCRISSFQLTLSPAPHQAELTFTYGE